jgi:hypothetical protein
MTREVQFAVVDETHTVISFAICDVDDESSKEVVLENFINCKLVESPIEDKVKLNSHYHQGAFFYPSWVFDASSNAWIAPDPYPSDGCLHRWVENDDVQGWDRLTPFPSWTWNEEENLAYPPVEYPTDGKNYTWDEATISWVEVTLTTE